MNLRLRFSTLVVSSVALSALAATDSRAAEGRTPIPFTSPASTPVTITQPGSYVLTRNLSATGPGEVIRITVPGTGGDVDLDLNGFLLNGTANPGTSVIRVTVSAGASSEVRIHNGATQGGARGIEVSGEARQVVVEDVRIGNTSSMGIYLTGALNSVIRNCVITDTGAAGIRIDPATQAKQATIEGNLLRNSQDGIAVFAFTEPTNAVIRANQVESTAGTLVIGAAIFVRNVSAGIISGNAVRGVTGGNGIELEGSSNVAITGNSVSGIAFHGISVDAFSIDNLLERNVVGRAAQAGLFVAGDRNQVEGNLLNFSGRGLAFDATAQGNVYRGNTARGNTGAFVCGGVCSADFCDSGAGNSSQGDNFLPAAPCN